MWVLHLEADHFNYVHVTDYARLSNMLSRITMAPMHQNASNLKPVMRGGGREIPLHTCEGVSLGMYWKSLQNWHQVDAQLLDSDQQQIMVHTVNVGGLRSSVEVLGAHIGPRLPCGCYPRDPPYSPQSTGT